MIEIYGAGIAGSYFANLIDSDPDYSYTVYEVRKEPDCRCAWGWANFSKVKKLVEKVGLNAEDYVLSRPRKALVNDIEATIKDVVTFDKPEFIRDLRDGIKVDYALRYPQCKNCLIVDATGNNRAVMRRFDEREPRTLKTVQVRAKTDLDQDFIYIYARKYGYAWAFPIGESEWHIGAGGFTKRQAIMLFEKLRRKYSISLSKKCKCGRDILYDLNLCTGVWDEDANTSFVAIGEAGGFVSGFGEGNTLAMETADCLYRALSEGDLNSVARTYSNNVWKEVEWIVLQHDFVNTLNKSWLKALFKLPSVIRVANMRNMRMPVWKGIRLMWSLRGGDENDSKYLLGWRC